MTHEERAAYDLLADILNSLEVEEFAAFGKPGEMVRRLVAENSELSNALARFSAAEEIHTQDFSHLPITEQQPAYIQWLEGKVKQLQTREQLVHEQGRGYAEPKIENRKLRAEIERLGEENARLRSSLETISRTKEPK